MLKILNLRIATEKECQTLVNNCRQTDASIAMSQVDTSKPLSDYERGRRDVASEILLLVGPYPTQWSPH